METLVLPADKEDTIPHALDILKRGGLVAFPTDTVYGVGALAFDAWTNQGLAIEEIAAVMRPVCEQALRR